MFCSQIAKHGKSFLPKRNIVSPYHLVTISKSSHTPNFLPLIGWNRSFSVAEITIEETNEKTNKKLLETRYKSFVVFYNHRSNEDEKRVKQYLSLINGCDLRKYYVHFQSIYKG